MEVKDMLNSDIEARKAEIKAEMLEASVERLEELNAEAEMLEARRAEIAAEAEKRAAVVEEVIAEKGEAEEVRSLEGLEITEEKTMTNAEVRKSAEYAEAFLRGLKKNDYTEARALLTENVEGGYVPVPVVLESEIQNSWADCTLLQKAQHTSFKGNVKIGFEVSATGAVVHVEGTDAPAEEQLVWGTVELKNENIKKWIKISDNAFENTTIDTINEIYKEIAQRIAEKAEEIALAKIAAAPTTATTSAPAVAEISVSAMAIDTIDDAVAELSAGAKTLTIVANRRTIADLKKAAKAANYSVDPFDGIEVYASDALPAMSAASSGQTVLIVGDFGKGLRVNTPNGNDVQLVVDYTSEAEKDLVKIVGKQLTAIEVVADHVFTRVKKA